MAGDASLCSISLMVLEAPKVLEVFFKLVVDFFLKHAKSISTGIRRAMDKCRRERSLHDRGRFGKRNPGNLSFLRLQGGSGLLGGSILRLLLLASVGSVRGGALPLTRQWDIVVGHDGDFLHLGVIDLDSHAILL